MAQKQPKNGPTSSPRTPPRTAASDRSAPARARGETDRGRTGDKVAAEDPAAAPLETDAEASGTATSGRAAAASHDDQTRIGKQARAAEPAFARNPQPGKANRQRRVVLGAVVVVLVLVGVLVGLGLV